MKKTAFLRYIVAVTTLLMAALSTQVSANDHLILEPIQVGAETYYFQGASDVASQENKGFMSNAGFVITSDGVLVYDTLGTPALGQAMIKAIENVTDQPIRTVIVSHYHADHIYGLQAFQDIGAQIWAHTAGRAYLHSDEAQRRLQQRSEDLSPWVDENTRLIPADQWLSFEDGNIIYLDMGNKSFEIHDVSGAHSPGDIMLYHPADNVLFAGDLYFTGRIPFVEDADSRTWLDAMDNMLNMDPDIVVPGHGPSSTNTIEDMELTRDYLLFLRQEMGAAVEEMMDFEEAYANTDWSAFEDYPTFEEANRINAYGQYLVMERESLEGP